MLVQPCVKLTLVVHLFIRFLHGWSGAEIKCTVHIVLPKLPINQFKLDQQSRQQALRAYCPNICTTVERILAENPLQDADPHVNPL